MKGLKQFGLVLCAASVGALAGVAATINWHNVGAAGDDDIGHEHELTPHTAVASTCEIPGMRAYWECEQCVLYFADDDGMFELHADDLVVPRLGHQSNQKYHHAEVKATCSTTGSKEYWLCMNGCGQFFKDEDCQEVLPKEWVTIAKTAHKVHKVTEQAATCAVPGHVAHWECDNCGKAFDNQDCDNEINPIVTMQHQTDEDHYFGHVDATCEKAGHDAYYACINCGAAFQDSKCKTAFNPTVGNEKLNHESDSNYYHAYQAPTCGKDGHVEYWTCMHGCQTKFADAECETPLPEDEVVLKAPYAKHNWVVNFEPKYLKKAATYNTPAVYYGHCTNEGCTTHNENYVREVDGFATLVNGTWETVLGEDNAYQYQLLKLNASALEERDGKHYLTVYLRTPRNYVAAFAKCNQIENLSAVVSGNQLALQICLDELPAANDNTTLTYEFDWDGNGKAEQVVKIQVENDGSTDIEGADQIEDLSSYAVKLDD